MFGSNYLLLIEKPSGEPCALHRKTLDHNGLAAIRALRKPLASKFVETIFTR